MTARNDKQIERRISSMLSSVNKDTNEPDKQFLEELRERSTAEFLAHSTDNSQESEKTIPISKWRIILKSRITKFTAAAAMIIIAVMLSVSLWDKSILSAYAVDQTIEAMRNVTTVHCFLQTFNGQKTEIWIDVNPLTGENEKFYFDNTEETRIVTLTDVYNYNKKSNVLNHMKGYFAQIVQNEVRFDKQFIEFAVDKAKSDNANVRIKSDSIDGKKKVILLMIETNDYEFVSRIDPITKLPISMQMIEPATGKINQSVNEITYNESLPEGIFDFEIPEGVQVIEQ